MKGQLPRHFLFLLLLFQRTRATGSPSLCPVVSAGTFAPSSGPRSSIHNVTFSPTASPATQVPSPSPTLSPRTSTPTSTCNPSKSPSHTPTGRPSFSPMSCAPTNTYNPTAVPSSRCPTTQVPSLSPTLSPRTSAPTLSPRTSTPTSTCNPSKSPSQGPSFPPSRVPTVTCNPTTAAPSATPFTFGPTVFKQVRLENKLEWGFPGTSRGLLQVYDAGNWNPVDDKSFTSKSADVVCKELQYDFGVPALSPSINIGSPINPAATEIRCNGDEKYLLDCAGNFFEGKRCSKDKCEAIIYVHCISMCSGQNQGASGTMVFNPLTDRCEIYNGNTPIRLAGSRFKQQGRIEFLDAGFWYSVKFETGTYHSESAITASLVCQYLGYSTGVPIGNTGFDFPPPIKYRPCAPQSSNITRCLRAYNPLLPHSLEDSNVLGATCLKNCSFATQYFDLATDACKNITVKGCPAGQYLTKPTVTADGRCTACVAGTYTEGALHNSSQCTTCSCPGTTFMKQQCDGTANNGVCGACIDDPNCGRIVPYKIDGPYRSLGFISMFIGTSWRSISRQEYPGQYVFGGPPGSPSSAERHLAHLVCTAYGYNTTSLNKQKSSNLISAVKCDTSVMSLEGCKSRGVDIPGESEGLYAQCIRTCNFTSEFFDRAMDGCLTRQVHSCPRGAYFVKGTTLRDGYCRACRSGSYIGEDGHVRDTCRVCSKCPNGTVLVKACNSTHDNAVCRTCLSVASCGQPNPVRIVNRTSRGYPEVYFNGGWRAVGFPWPGISQAKVQSAVRICKDLGYYAGVWSSEKDAIGAKFPFETIECQSAATSFLSCNGIWVVHNNTRFKWAEVRCYRDCSFTNEIYDNVVDACVPATGLTCGPGYYLVPKTVFDHGQCIQCSKGFFMPNQTHTYTSCNRCSRCPSELIFGRYCNATHDNNHCISKSPTTSSPTTLSPSTTSPSTRSPTQTPTTCAPSSCAPTTTAPSSLSPTTMSPTSVAPSTLSPTTLSPSTMSPTSVAPSTLSPTTLSPTTGSPTSVSPATCSPSTTCPTQSPTSCSPTTSNPTMKTPTLIDIRLTDEVTAIALEFHETTNMRIALPRSHSANCELLLDSASLSLLGRSQQCHWKTASTFLVYFGKGFTFNLFDLIGIKDGLVKRENEVMDLYSPAHSRPLMPPLNPPPVWLQIAGPREVGECDEGVQLTALATGAVGRPFTFEWELQATTLSSNATASGMAAIAAARRRLAAHTNSSMFLPTLALPVKATYVLRVRAVNWLGTFSQVKYTLRKSSKLVLVVALPSGPSLFARRSKNLDIRVQARPPQCDALANSARQLTTRGHWTLIDYSSNATANPVQIPNPFTFYLSLPPYTLEMQQWYVFQLYAYTTDASGQVVGNATATFNVTTVLEPVVAKIYGGDFRRVSKDSAARNSSKAIFDASPSYDQENTSAPLIFSWSLRQETLGIGGASALVPISHIARNQSVFQVPLSALVPGNEYVARVLVRSKSRTASAEQRILVSNDIIPDVFISHLSTESASFGPQVELKIISKVESSAAFRRLRYQWSCKSGNLDVEDSSLLLSDISNPSLALKSNALLPGTAYTFAVAVYGESGGSNSLFGEAQINVLVRAPPSLGSCQSKPESGTAFHTWFRLQCKDWSGAGEPFRYQFQAYSLGTFTNLCEYQFMNEYVTQLPGSNERVLLRGVVADQFGVTAYDDFTTTVIPARNFDANARLHSLEERKKEGDFQTYGATLASICSQLNSQSASSPSAVQEIRASLLESLNRTTYALSSDSSSSLLRLVSTYTAPEELSSTSKECILQISKGLLEVGNDTAIGEYDPVTEKAMSNLLAGVSNVVSASTQPQYQLSSNNSDAAENVMFLIAKGLIRESIAGEKQKSLKASSAGIGLEVLGTVFTVDSGGTTSLRLGSLNSSATFPPLDGFLPANSPASIIATMVTNDTLRPRDREQRVQTLLQQDRETYSEDETSPEADDIHARYKAMNWVSGGLAAVQILNSNKEEVRISGLRRGALINVTIPAGGNSTSPLGYQNPRCLFWDPQTSLWSTRGLQSVRVDSEGRVTCSSSHLTAFSSEMEFRFEINTISADSLTLDAFNPAKNPVMLLVVGMVSMFIILYAVAFYYDRKRYLASSRSNQLAEFWKMTNLMRIYRSQERTMKRFAESSKWALRRKHTWFSIVFHPPGDFMSSGKRLILLLVLLLNSSVVCALFVGTEQRIPFLNPSLASSLVGFVFSYPVPFVMGMLFYNPMPPSFIVKIDRGSGDTFMSYLLLCFSLCSGEIVDFDMEMEEGEDEGAADAEDADYEDDGNEEALVDEKSENSENSDSDDNVNTAQRSVKGHLSKAKPSILPSNPFTDETDEIRKPLANHMATGGAVAVAGVLGQKMGTDFARSRNAPKQQSGRDNDSNSCAATNSNGSRSALLGDRKAAISTTRQLSDSKHHFDNSISKQNSWVDAKLDVSTNLTASGARATAWSACHSSNDSTSNAPSNLLDTIKRTKKDKQKLTKMGSVRKQNTRRKLSRRLSRRMSTRFHLNNFPKDSFDDSHHEFELPPFWSRKDYLTTFVFVIFTLGAVFMLAALSWQYRDSNDASVEASMMAFVQDIFFRALIILMVEAVFLLPCCCQGISERGQGRTQLTPRMGSGIFILESGVNYFSYNKAAVILTVTPQGAAIGIRQGWKVKSVKGEPVSDGIECCLELNKAGRIAGYFEIGFEMTNHLESWVSGPMLPDTHSTHDIKSKKKEISSVSATNSSISLNSMLTDHDRRFLLPSAQEVYHNVPWVTPDKSIEINSDGDEKNGNDSDSTTFLEEERRDLRMLQRAENQDSDDSEGTTFSEMERRDMREIVAENVVKPDGASMIEKQYQGENVDKNDGIAASDKIILRADLPNNSKTTGKRTKNDSRQKRTQTAYHRAPTLYGKKKLPLKRSGAARRPSQKKRERNVEDVDKKKKMPSVFQRLTSGVNTKRPARANKEMPSVFERLTSGVKTKRFQKPRNMRQKSRRMKK